MEYSYVTTGENGNNVVIASGEFEDGAQPPDVGDSVTLEGKDGVDRPWKVVRSEEVPYVGLKIYVEPLEIH